MTALEESRPATSVPNLWQYAIRKKCHGCGAKPLVLCWGAFVKNANDRGLGPEDVRRLHHRRVQAGRKHRLWDVSVGAPEAFAALLRGVG